MGTFKKAEPGETMKEICQRCGRIAAVSDSYSPAIGWYEVEVIEHVSDDETEEDSLVICDVCGGALVAWLRTPATE
jgi:rRNA maturation protein Nop10